MIHINEIEGFEDTHPVKNEQRCPECGEYSMWGDSQPCDECCGY